MFARIASGSLICRAGAFSGKMRLNTARNAVVDLSCNSQQRNKYTLVLIRHGESTWNQLNKFTGWYDCPLSEKGHKEAVAAGELLAKSGLKFDIAYTSMLQRAIRTLWHTLEQMQLMYIPIVNTWKLNERHYGGLQVRVCYLCVAMTNRAKDHSVLMVFGTCYI